MDTATDLSITEKKVAEAPFNDPKADFIVISSDGVLFYVHRILLTIASPAFETILSSPDKPQEKYDERPCVTLGDEAKNLRLLFTWCYKHRSDGMPTSLDDLKSVLELTHKYSMDQITAQVEDTLLKMPNVVAAEPLRVFCIAARFRLLALAHAAAIETLKAPISGWREIPEMEQIPASTIVRLIQYRGSCVDALVKEDEDEMWPEANIWGFGTLAQALSRRDVSHAYKDGCRGTDWYEDYKKRVNQALERCPSAATLNSTFLQESLTKIKSLPCGTCRINAPSHLIVIQQELIKEIEEKIRQVDFGDLLISEHSQAIFLNRITRNKK